MYSEIPPISGLLLGAKYPNLFKLAPPREALLSETCELSMNDNKASDFWITVINDCPAVMLPPVLPLAGDRNVDNTPSLPAPLL